MVERVWSVWSVWSVWEEIKKYIFSPLQCRTTRIFTIAKKELVRTWTDDES
ncbi:MAG: hypothetical protein F6K40_35575 [Okeania sp. SIO3I5]|uniref:hypothetical protein n=1 Tax=Okeania sp. SIO3I5 TaxID=2607805 RepID=UPI0013B7431D|nr:hypothetical protein [Okeania sp. SIO3I5]NEQ41237.1 hypothetical protein [Okeania sp. SIO3I5]